MQILRILIAISLVGVASVADAATITAATCFPTDVQAAINSTASGDTVAIPSGTCSWTSGVSISGKGIRLLGSGSGRIIAYTADTLTVAVGAMSTTITMTNTPTATITAGQTLRISQLGNRANFMEGTVTAWNSATGLLALNVTSTGGSGATHRWLVSTPPATVLTDNISSGATMIDITEDVSRHVEIGGIKIGAGAATGNGIVITPVPTGLAVLIHDCWFESGPTMASSIRSGTNRGVVWYSSFDSSPFSLAPLAVQRKDPTNNTVNSWTTPSTMGAADTTGQSNFYVEDCDFHAWLNATDSDDNTRTVYRRNLMNNAAFGSHGADTSSYGNRHFEIYDNRLVFNGYSDGTTFNMNWWVFVRGGTFVFTGNTVDKIVSSDYGNKQDVLMTIENLGRDSGPNPCWGLNTTGGVDYHVPRQVGFGYVTGLGHAPDSTGTANDAIIYVGDSEPAYIWNNTVNNGPLNVGVSDYGNVSGNSCFITRGGTPDSVANYIAEGRDYFNDGTIKPGWTRYTYPHPLRATAVVPATPTNLRIQK